MTKEVAKQLIFDCAMELLYEQEGLSRITMAGKLLNALDALDDKTNDL